VNARDFDPEAYAIPDSAWRDGPAAGVVVRNKRQGRGKLRSGYGDGRGRDRSGSRRSRRYRGDRFEYATDDRFERVVDDLDRRNAGATVDAVADRVVEAIARETPVRFGEGSKGTAPDRVRAAIIERARVALDRR